MVKRLGAKDKKARAPRVIKVGTDFTGMNSGGVALKRMLRSDKYNVMFSSDISPQCRQLLKIMPGNKAQVMYKDVLERNVDDMSEVDVYLWTPPCQSYSAAGKRGKTTSEANCLQSVSSTLSRRGLELQSWRMSRA